jgi:predicted transglutaminase-like cysteine proteinase
MFGRASLWDFAASLVVVLLVVSPSLTAIAARDEVIEPKNILANNPTEKPKLIEDADLVERQARAPNDTRLAAPARVAALGRVGAAIAPPPPAEPFGLAATSVTSGDVLTKWRRVEADIRAEDEVLAHCRHSADRCPAAVQNFLAIIEQGRAQTGRTRIGVINRAINLAIEPMSDLAQWGVPDRWSAPLETFTTGRGDCEDYAIAKYVALRLAGVSADDLRLVVMRDTIRGDGHAVAAARLDGHWLMLDNNRMAMVEDADMRNYRPLFVLDERGVMRYIDTPLLAALPGPDPALLAFNLADQPAPIASPN